MDQVKTAEPRITADRKPAGWWNNTGIQMRFAAIWIALAVVLIVGAIFLPRTVAPATINGILPFAAFLAIASMGQALVIMARGIDLSVPAIITLSSTMLLGFSGGSDSNLFLGIVAALFFATLVGLINGLLVAVLRLNALIVTLAVGAIVSGVTLWYRQQVLAQEAGVPPSLAEFGGARFLGQNTAVWIAILLVIVLTVLLRRSLVGRRFETVGANPVAAYATGVEVMRYQAGAFMAAAFLYGVAGVLLSAFIRNPTLQVGNDYLLAPIAAAVLGGTAISGGIGSMIAVAGAALFLTQLGQALKVIGLPTSWQLIVQGCAIAAGMLMSEWSSRRR